MPAIKVDIRFDPYHNIREDQKKRVLGGQVSLWAEQVRLSSIVGDVADAQTDETNLESVMWPRAAALAEVFWTGAGEGEYPRSKPILASADNKLIW